MSETTEYVVKPNYDFENCPTRAVPGAPLYEEDVFQAIYATSGNYAAISVLLARRRTSVRDYILSRPYLKQALDEVRDVVIDKAEDNIFQAVFGGDDGASKFVLTTIGKGRGYSTRQEFTGENGGPVRLINSAMTPEEAAEAYADTL